MKKYTFMWEKYPLTNDDPVESLFPVPEGYECSRVCRYGDGYVYRVYKIWVEAEPDEFPCRGYLYFYSVSKQELYKTVVYDQIKIHMTDFEHGCAYATGFEFLQEDEWTSFDCDGEVWCDRDMRKIQ